LDIDLFLAGGIFQNHTLRGQDTWVDCEACFEIIPAPSGNHQLTERLVFFKPNGILGYRMSQRMERRYAPTATPGAPQGSPTPPTPGHSQTPE